MTPEMGELLLTNQAYLLEAISPLWTSAELSKFPAKVIKNVIAVIKNLLASQDLKSDSSSSSNAGRKSSAPKVDTLAPSLPRLLHRCFVVVVVVVVRVWLLSRLTTSFQRYQVAVITPNPDLVAGLMAMGFPRARANRALIETSNDIEMATDWLFSQAEESEGLGLFGGGGGGGAGGSAGEGETDEDDELAMALAMSIGKALELPGTGAPSTATPAAATAAPAAAEAEPLTIEERRAAAYSTLQGSLLEQCLALLQSTHASAPDVIEAVYKLMTSNCNVAEADLTSMVSSLITHPDIYSPASASSKALFNLSFVVSLLVASSASFSASFVASELPTKFVNSLDALAYRVQCHSAGTDKPQTAVPKWGAPMMLSLDSLWNAPPSSSSGSGDEPVLSLESPCRLSADLRGRLVNTCASLLKTELDPQTLQAVLQVVARLTRERAYAGRFLELGGLKSLLSVPQQRSFVHFIDLVEIIVRHLIEDPQTLQEAFESELSRLMHFDGERNASTGVQLQHFVALFAHLINRDSEAFVQAAKKRCRITSRDQPLVRLRAVEASPTAPSSSSSMEVSEAGSSTTTTAAATSSSSSSSTSSSDGDNRPCLQTILPILVSALLNSTSSTGEQSTEPDCEPMSESSSAADSATVTSKPAGGKKNKDKDERRRNKRPVFIRATLLQLLADIVPIYRGSNALLAGDSLSSNQSFLQYVLRHVLPYPKSALVGTQQANGDPALATCSMAKRLLTSLWSDGESRERLMREIVQVLHQTASAAGTTSSTALPSSDKHHAHDELHRLATILSLSDLLSALVSARVGSPAQTIQHQMELAKLTLDTNAVEALVAALHSIDLDSPYAPRIVNTLLKPLEALTRLVSFHSKVPTPDQKTPFQSLIVTGNADRWSIDDPAEVGATDRRGGNRLRTMMNQLLENYQEHEHDDEDDEDGGGSSSESSDDDDDDDDDEDDDGDEAELGDADEDDDDGEDEDDEDDDGDHLHGETIDLDDLMAGVAGGDGHGDDEDRMMVMGDEEDDDDDDDDEDDVAAAEDDDEDDDEEEEEEDDDERRALDNFQRQLFGAGQLPGEGDPGIRLLPGGIPAPGQMTANWLEGQGAYPIRHLFGRHARNIEFDMAGFPHPGGVAGGVAGGGGASNGATATTTVVHPLHQALRTANATGAGGAAAAAMPPGPRGMFPLFLEQHHQQRLEPEPNAPYEVQQLLRQLTSPQTASAALPRYRLWTDDYGPLTNDMVARAALLAPRLLEELYEEETEEERAAVQVSTSTSSSSTERPSRRASLFRSSRTTAAASPRAPIDDADSDDDEEVLVQDDDGNLYAPTTTQSPPPAAPAAPATPAAAAAPAPTAQEAQTAAGDELHSLLSSLLSRAVGAMPAAAAATTTAAAAAAPTAAGEPSTAPAAIASLRSASATPTPSEPTTLEEVIENVLAARGLSRSSTPPLVRTPSTGVLAASGLARISTPPPTAVASTAGGGDAMEVVSVAPSVSTEPSAIARSASPALVAVPATPAVPTQDERLTAAGYDPVIFATLPEEIQREVLASLPPISTGAPAVAAGQAGGAEEDDVWNHLPNGMSRETLMELPEDLREEILNDVRATMRAQQEPAADPTHAQDMSPTDIIASLAPELRREVLMTMPENQLFGLPPGLQAEAQALRERNRRAVPAEQLYPRIARGGYGMPEREDERRRAPSYYDYEGEPLLNETDLVGIVRLLYLSDPWCRSLESRLFENLCAHPATRVKLLTIFLRLLCAKRPAASTRPSEEALSCLSLQDQQSLALVPTRNFSPLADPFHAPLGFQPFSCRRLGGGASAASATSALATSGQQPQQLTPSLSSSSSGAAATTTTTATHGSAYYSHSYHSERTPLLVLKRVLAVLTHTAKSNPRVIALMLGLEGVDEIVPHLMLPDSTRDGKAPASTSPVTPLCLLLEFLGDESLGKNAEILEAAMQLVSLLVSPLLTFEEADELAKKAASSSSSSTTSSDSSPPAAAVAVVVEGSEAAPSGATTVTVTDAAPMEQETSTTAATTSVTTTTTTTEPSTTASTAEVVVADEAAGATTTSSDATGAATGAVLESSTSGVAESEREPEKLACPSIAPEYLRYLPRALTFDSCSERTYQYALEILHHLCANNDNRLCLLEELLSTATTLGQHVSQNLLALKAQLSSSSIGSVAMSVVSTSSVHEVAFLRLLKLMHTLGSSLPTSRLSLDGLWSALDQSLAVINACLPNAEQGQEAAEAESSASTTTSTIATPLVGAPARRNAPAAEAAAAAGATTGGDASTASPVLSLLLPVIEAYFIVMESQEEQDAATMASDMSSSSSSSSSSAAALRSSLSQSTEVERSVVGQFVARNRRILNDLVRLNNTLLQRSFKSLIKYPQYLEFDNKRAYFRAKLRENDGREHMRYGGVRIAVNRSNVFFESYQALKPLAAAELKGRLTVHFHGEEGIDAGGVLRDWYDTISQEIFNPNYALFTQAADSCFQPNKLSSCNPDHLDYFRFCGRVIAKAIYDGCLMDAHFTRSFYKHMLGKRVTWRDLEPADPEYFKNLSWILENDGSQELELTFSINVNRFGKVQVVDLKPNGRDILVTDENKHEYVQLLAEMLITDAIKEQIDAFVAGLWELIPRDLLAIFNEGELELLISGLPEINIDDLRANTEYSGYKPDSLVIQRFWNVLHSFDNEERALFLQFVTGSSKVPLEGFKALVGMGRPQKFNIHRVPDTDRLPTAHTWYVNILSQLSLSLSRSLYVDLYLSINQSINLDTQLQPTRPSRVRHRRGAPNSLAVGYPRDSWLRIRLMR